MSDVERFEPAEDCGCGGGRMRPWPDGDWVRYQDYHALVAAPPSNGFEAGLRAAKEAVTKIDCKYIDDVTTRYEMATFREVRRQCAAAIAALPRPAAEESVRRNKAECLLNSAMYHIAGTLEQPTDARAWSHLLTYCPDEIVEARATHVIKKRSGI